MGTWAGTGGALAWVIVSDDPSNSLAMRATVEHIGSHKGSIRTHMCHRLIVGCAADGCRKHVNRVLGTPKRVPRAVFCGSRTQWDVMSAAAAKNRVGNRNWGPERRLLHAPTTVARRRHHRWLLSELRRHPEHGYMGWYWWSIGLVHCQ